ncbi:unnamed protein product, partial [Mesorhabditis belari]|uniref:C-type lectin domain-containing protein n=1 Tax=Mesorhabditis belari TaxID=2138241 RepID=A0AAF3EQA0_9BILA
MPEMTEELPEKSVKRIEEPAISLPKIAQLEADLEEMKEDQDIKLSRVTAKIAQIEANLMGKIAKLEADLVDGRERNRELERKIAETKRKNDDLEAQLRTQNTEVRQGKAKIEELEGKINALQSKNFDLETQVKLQADLGTQNTEGRDGKAKLEELERKINALQSKISGFETQIEFERENETAEMVKLRSDLKRTMNFLDPDGWSYLEKTASWYKVIGEEMTFDESVAYCAKQKGHLVSIHSREENNFVWRLAKRALSGCFFSIGLKANPNKGNAFEWTDGSSVDFTYWKPPWEPDSRTHAFIRIYDGTWLGSSPTDRHSMSRSSTSRKRNAIIEKSIDNFGDDGEKTFVGNGGFGAVYLLKNHKPYNF